MYKVKLFSKVKKDLPASLVVFFVALPLCLGIALASGAPLFSGLIAGIVGGIVVGSISGSPLGVSGPAAGLAVVVLNAISELGSFEIFLTAVILAGVIQILLGFFKAGVIGYYFPSSVIKGMLTGIGIIIILKQIPYAFGYDADYEGSMGFWQMDGENTFSELINMLNYINPGAVIVSAVSLFILIFWDKVLMKKSKAFTILQGPLVAVLFGIGYQYFSSVYFPGLALGSSNLVNVPVSDDLGSFVSQFTFPDFTAFGQIELYIVAVTMAVVASLETLLSVEAVDKLDRHKRTTPTNRELIAQGTGNIVSGLIGGLPITQVIVRSSANVQSGGETKLSTIIHGTLLLLCVMIIPHFLNLVPLAVLACVLFVVGYKLAKPSLFRSMYKLGWKQFTPFFITIVGIVFTDLLIGITLGLIVAVFIILRNNYKNSHFLKMQESHNGDKHVNIVLAEEVTFLNKAHIQNQLNNVPDGSDVTIDLRSTKSMDYDVTEIIHNFKQTADDRNIKVTVLSHETFLIADY